MLLGDGVRPRNTGSGYVLRRLIRRSVRHSRLLGLDPVGQSEVIERSIEQLGQLHGHVREQRDEIVEILRGEGERFERTLERGLRQLDRLSGTVDGGTLHGLSETHGLPVEISVEELVRRGVPLDPCWSEQFDERQREHSERSRR